MTFNIKLEVIDFYEKDLFYKKIYSCLSVYGYYSGIILIRYLDNREDEWSFTYINDPSITMSVLNNKSECDLEHIYYFIRSIIRESDNDILYIELKFTKK